MQTVSAWSYSTMDNFLKCKHRVFHEKILKSEKPPLVPPPGKEEHPLDRGIRVHEAAELYIQGKPVELAPELQDFKEEYDKLRDFYEAGFVKVEEDWAYTEDWKTTSWFSDDAWLRMKLDALVIRGDEAINIDHKTGRKFGNEIKFMTQAQLYQLGIFMRYPEIEHVTTEFWCVDVNELVRFEFPRKKGLKYLELYTQRGLQITTETNFAPNPSSFSCKWCPFRSEEEGGSGACDYTVV